MKKLKKTAISLTLALLPLITAAGQLRQENNYITKWITKK